MIEYNDQEHLFYCADCSMPVELEEIDDYLLRSKCVCLIFGCGCGSSSYKMHKNFNESDFIKTENRYKGAGGWVNK